MNRINNKNSYFYLNGMISAEDLETINTFQQLGENYVFNQEELVIIRDLFAEASYSLLNIRNLIQDIKFPNTKSIANENNSVDRNYKDIGDKEEDEDDNHTSVYNLSDNVEVKIQGEEPITIGEIKEVITYLEEQIRNLNPKVVFLRKFTTPHNRTCLMVSVEEYMRLSALSNVKLCTYSPARGQNKNLICANNAINGNIITNLHELRCGNCFLEDGTPKEGKGKELIEEYQRQMMRNTAKFAALKK